MTWKELLLTLRQDVLNDRSSRIDGDSDQLWSDATMIRYLNEAQRRFARRSLCIRDGSSAATRIVLVAGQGEYPIAAGMLSLLSARYVGSNDYLDPNPYMRPDRIDLARASHDTFSGGRPINTRWFDCNATEFADPGKPIAVSCDEETYDTAIGSASGVTLRVFPVPSVQYSGGILQLRIVRDATTLANGDDLSTRPEIPEDYHLALVEYAAAMCLRIVDHELGDPVRSAEMEASFNRKVEEARKELLRKSFAPMQFGFNHTGNSYVGN